MRNKMAHSVQPFRASYRSKISKYYNVYLHGAFVFFVGVCAIIFFASKIHNFKLVDSLAFVFGILFFNVCEYYIHKSFGHRKNPVALLFYKRHTGDHHSFFSDDEMYFDQAQDWRVILFPPWLVVLISILLFGIWSGVSILNQNMASLFSMAVMGSFLCYEIFHVCAHVPPGYWFTELPWIRMVRRLHTIHHRRHLMADRNFNILFPMMDRILKTIVQK